MSNINLQNLLSPTSSIGDKDEAKNDINCFDWRNEKPRSGNITLEVPVPRNTFHYFKSWTIENVKETWPGSETGYTEQDQSNLLNDINGFYKQTYREVGDVVVVTETYRSSKGFPGRLYSSNGCQGLVRAVRSNMLSETADADMRNGQPTVVVYTCRNLDAIKTPTFEDYVENRDNRLPQIMKEAGVSKGKAKQLVIMTLTSEKLLKTRSAYLNKLDHEAKRIQVALMARPDLQWILPFCKNPENIAGSFMSLLYQFVENKLLMCCFDMLTKDGIGVSALVFDGMNLTDGRHHGDEELLDRLHNACERIAPGINMIWAWKPLDFVLESKEKKPLINSDGSKKLLKVPSSYTPPLQHRKRKFAKHTSELHEGPSGQDESPSLNASCVLSKSSCDLSPFNQIGFLGSSFKETPSFNMDTFRQSLLLDVNPVSFQPQFYEVVEDPSNPGFDGSSHVFDKQILSLTNSLNETIGAGSECAHHLSTLTAAIGRSDGCVRKLLHLPLMQRQQLKDDRFDMGTEETWAPDLPFVTENRCLVVPHDDGQSTYLPNTNLAAVLLNSKLRVSCTAAETEGDGSCQEVSLTLAYDNSHNPIWCLEVSNSNGFIVFNSSRQSAPQKLVRDILCLWEWSEQELKVNRRKHAPSYSPPWQAALLAMSNSPGKAAQLSTSLLLNQLGPSLRYEPRSKSFWFWTPRSLWEQDVEPGAAVKASATQLCESAVHLLHRSDAFARAKEDALKRFPFFMAESAKRKRNYDDGDGDGCNLGAGDEGAFCDDELQLSIASRTLSTSLSTQPRTLDRVVTSMKDFVIEHGFEEAFQKTQALAFANGVQDMFTPYAFHQPTPADRVYGRLPYAMDPAPTSNEEMEELKQWVINRYSLFGFDRETALREADKDAVTLTGNPAVLSQANIRVHLGPYDATKKEYGSRCGKNLRLTMLQSVFAYLLNDKMSAGFLSMKMVPGKAYSMFNGIEHQLSIWIDEGQNKKHNEESKVESWNEGMVLKIATGSAAPQFQYRLENGREKTVTLKTQSINVSSNKVSLPNNAGIRSKLEVSPYPNLGYHTDAEVQAAKDAGQGAFKIDPKMLDVVQQNPGKLMRYYVERAKTILSNPEDAYPRSQAIIDATARVLEQSTVGASEQLDATGAQEQLQIICEKKLKECSSAERTLESANGDAPDFNKFQLKSPRCFCVGCPTGGACHFKVEAFSGLLKTDDIELYNFYVKKANQTGRLASALQKVLCLNERPLTKVNKYGHGCIFGWTIA